MVVTGPALETWHKSVDWSQIAGAGHRVVWCPITEGIATMYAPRFQDQWDAIADAGLLRGAVHRLTTAYVGRGEARHFVDVLGADLAGSLTAVAVRPNGHRRDDRLPGLDQVADFAAEFRRLTGGHPLIIRTAWRWWAPRDPDGKGQRISPWLWHHDGRWAAQAAAGDLDAMGRWGSYGGWPAPIIWSIPRTRCPGVTGLCTLTVLDDPDLAKLTDMRAPVEREAGPRAWLHRLRRRWARQAAAVLS